MHRCRIALPLVLAILSAACGLPGSGPLSRVETASPPPSPGLRNPGNRLDIHYHLNSPATVSSRIVAPDGSEWILHSSTSRPTRGDYVLHFDGTVPGQGPNERQVLADGDYRVILQIDTDGQRQESQIPLSIRDADPYPPELSDLQLLPDHISPNFDAFADISRITYRLSKDARVSPYLDEAGTAKRIWSGEETRALAGEQSFTFTGTINNGQPVAPGEYVFGIRAQDDAGNVVERGAPLVVEGAGTPEAVIVRAHIGPLQIVRGGEVCLDATVRNSGSTVLRTQGPDSGYVYNSLDTYASIEDHRYAEHAGFWRVGMSWSGGLDVSGASYPYRWGLGHDLAPGEEADIHGCVKVLNEQDKLVYFAGLIQENVAIRNQGVGLVRVQISS